MARTFTSVPVFSDELFANKRLNFYDFFQNSRGLFLFVYGTNVDVCAIWGVFRISKIVLFIV